MANKSELALSDNKKNCVKFNDRIQIHSEIAVCGSIFSIGHGGENDINRHKDTSNHKRYVDAAQQQRKLTEFGASLVTANLKQKVVKAELCFSGFLVEHNLPLSTLGHAGKNAYVNKYQCGRTKTIRMITGAVAKEITSNLKEDLKEAVVDLLVRTSNRWNKRLKRQILLVLVTYIDKDSGLIAT